jgi:type II secretion system protein N
MRFLKNNRLWFTLYGILITLIFLYLLFPADIVKDRLEASLNSPDFVFKAQSLQASFPLGLKFKNVVANTTVATGSFSLQTEMLDVQPQLSSLFKKYSYVSVSGKAYGGSFDGNVGLVSWSKAYPPVEGKLKFQNIDLSRANFLAGGLGKEIKGKASGSLFYNIASAARQNPSGAITLVLVKGNYPLAEAFLGINKIEYDRCEIQAQLKDGSLKIEKFEMLGPQINCSLKGEIAMADDLKNSQLNLTGSIEIQGKNKLKTNITIGGTLANPISRYI